MNPFEFPDLYDHVLLGGQRTPGVCKLSGFSRPVDWDVKPGGGQDGASTSRKGKSPAKGSVQMFLVDEHGQLPEQDEWQAFAAYLQLLQDQGTAIDVYHPDLATLKITSVVVTSVGLVTHDGKGGASVSFELLEYFPPKPKPVKKATSKSSGTKPGEPAKPDPNAAYKAELAELLKQANAP